MAEAFHVPAHLAPPGSPRAKQLQHLHALSPGQSCRGQEKACAYACRATSVVSGSLQPCRLWPAGFSVRGFSRQEHWSGLASTGCHTFWSTVYPAAPAANPPEDLVWPEPLRPKQLPHLPTWPSQGRTQVPQGSLRSKPQWTTHAEVEIKPQLKPGGSVAEEEDPKPAHQL